MITGARRIAIPMRIPRAKARVISKSVIIRYFTENIFIVKKILYSEIILEEIPDGGAEVPGDRQKGRE